jgi:hypothetical protein
VAVEDLHTFSDASSKIGIRIVIGERWRAWRLIPGWNSPGSGRDIGWAEAVGFFFLAATIAYQRPSGENYRLYGDNMGVVEGWWNGRSQNRETNDIFKLVNEISAHTNSLFYTRYVPTELNPADAPSRGIYGPTALLLPAPIIPENFRHLIIDFNHPRLQIERKMAKKNILPTAKLKPPRTKNRGSPGSPNNNRASTSATQSA